MADAIDYFILWSGWLAAVGIAIYEIVKAYRNRIVIQVSLAITGDDICVGVHNWDRRPVNFVEAGLVYTNGKSTTFDDISAEFPFWLYSKDGTSLCFNLRAVTKELKLYKTQVDYGYFTDEAGSMYKKEIPKEIEDYINELIASEKTKSK
jgi:hypothetical protein